MARRGKSGPSLTETTNSMRSLLAEAMNCWFRRGSEIECIAIAQAIAAHADNKKVREELERRMARKDLKQRKYKNLVRLHSAVRRVDGILKLTYRDLSELNLCAKHIVRLEKIAARKAKDEASAETATPAIFDPPDDRPSESEVTAADADGPVADVARTPAVPAADEAVRAGGRTPAPRGLGTLAEIVLDTAQKIASGNCESADAHRASGDVHPNLAGFCGVDTLGGPAILPMKGGPSMLRLIKLLKEKVMTRWISNVDIYVAWELIQRHPLALQLWDYCFNTRYLQNTMEAHKCITDFEMFMKNGDSAITRWEIACEKMYILRDEYRTKDWSHD